jgi:hypothetical protein
MALAVNKINRNLLPQIYICFWGKSFPKGYHLKKLLILIPILILLAGCFGETGPQVKDPRLAYTDKLFSHQTSQ